MFVVERCTFQSLKMILKGTILVVTTTTVFGHKVFQRQKLTNKTSRAQIYLH